MAPEQPTAGGSKEYDDSLFEGDADPLQENEEWAAAVPRLRVPDASTKSARTFTLSSWKCSPPKLLRGSFFAFAEGQEPLHVILRRQERYLGRMLIQEEADRLCELAGLPKHYGSY